MTVYHSVWAIFCKKARVFSIDGKLLDFRVLLIDDGKITTIVLRENTAKYPVAGNGSATHSDLLSLLRV